MASRSGATANSSVLMLFMSAFGVVTLSFDKVSGHLTFSYIKIAYSLLLITLISCGLYFQIKTYLERRIVDELIHVVLYLYPMVADSLMCILIILASFYSNKIFIDFMNSSENFFLLQSMPQFFNRDVSIRQLLLSSLFFVAPYLLDIFYYHSSIESRPILYQVLSYIFVLYNYMSLNQFSLILTTITSIYQSVNGRISELCSHREAEIFPLTNSWKIAISERLPFENSPAAVMKSDLQEVLRTEELYKLRGKHHQTYRFCRAVNSMFALINVGLVVHHGILGVIHSYWGLRQALSKHRTNDVRELVNSFRSAFVSFLSIIWLVMPTTALAAEVSKTRLLIQKSLINSKDQHFYSEIKTFALQLMLETVSFSPYGFFELGNELLLSLLSAIVSYLVILLQYQIMLDEQTPVTAVV